MHNVGVIESRRHSPLQIFNHYSSHNELSRTLFGTAMSIIIITYRRIGACLGVYGAPAVSVNSVLRAVPGTARLCTSFNDMPFPLKVKAPSLKGLFSSSKKRTKAQGHGAPEVQSEDPDR